MSHNLHIWTNASLDAAHLNILRDQLKGHKLSIAGSGAESRSKTPTPDPNLLDADVAFGQPDPEQILCATKLRWIQLDSAGYTQYDNVELGAKLREHRIVLTNSSSVTDEPCAQHAFAMMLALSRQLPQAALVQQQRKWAVEELAAGCRLLTGQTALLLGFGAIAKRLIELLAPLRMRIVAMRREIRGDEPVDIVTADDVNDVLGQADHVVNILPAGPTTGDFVDTARLQLLKRGAVFYNIGRGTTVDQQALIEVLSDGRLRAAYLDVTNPEPLPSDSPLWRTPNCFITPHIAAAHTGVTDELIKHFLDNVKRFKQGEKLRDQVV